MNMKYIFYIMIMKYDTIRSKTVLVMYIFLNLFYQFGQEFTNAFDLIIYIFTIVSQYYTYAQ